MASALLPEVIALCCFIPCIPLLWALGLHVNNVNRTLGFFLYMTVPSHGIAHGIGQSDLALARRKLKLHVLEFATVPGRARCRPCSRLFLISKRFRCVSYLACSGWPLRGQWLHYGAGGANGQFRERGQDSPCRADEALRVTGPAAS